MRPCTLIALGFAALLSCSPKSAQDPSQEEILTLLLLADGINTANRAYRFIFVTSADHNGNFGGVIGADSVCNSQKPSQLTATGQYKALLADGVNRRASLNTDAGDGQVDWVLTASREYRRSDGKTLFTANSNRLINFTAGLANAVTTSAGLSIWTGLDPGWTDVSADCLGWTSSSAVQAGETGSTTQVNTSLIHDIPVACDQTSNRRLLCVEQ